MKRFTLLVLVLSGCGSPRPEADAGPALTTSAGLRVYDSTAVVCDVLVHPGDSLPARIGSVAVGPGGLLAWEATGDSMIIIQTANGTQTRIRGTPGKDGFVGAKALGWRGDTLWLSDLTSSRVQRFGPDGKWRGGLVAADLATWVPSDDGRLRAIAPFGITRGVPDTVRAILVTMPGSRRIDTVAKFPTPPIKFIPSRTGAFPDPLGAYTVVGGALDGSRWCAVIALSDGNHFRCVNAEGKQQLDRILPIEKRPVTDEIFHMVVGAAMRAGQRDISELQKLISRPEFLPAVFLIRINRDSSAWLLRSEPSEPVQRWLRLAADGTPRDEWHLPRRYALREMIGDSVWSSESDAAGLQTLTRCVAKQQTR